MTRSPRHLTTASLLFAVLALGALVRFYQLDERGLDGSDNVYYTTIAKAWSEGDRIYRVADDIRVYRPVIYFLYGAGIRLLGFDDASIKRVNATADTLNSALIFIIGLLLLKRDPWPAFAAALIYACSPIAIEMARSELTHAISTSMVLLALLFFIRHGLATGTWAGRLHLLLAGLFTGAAVLTHEELILTAPAYALFLLAIFWRSNRGRPEVEDLVLNLSIFSGSLILASRKVFPVHMRFVLDRALSLNGEAATHSTSSHPLLSYLERSARYLWDAVVAFGSAPTLLLALPLFILVPAASLLVLSRSTRRTVPRLLFLPPIVVLSYVAGVAFLLDVFLVRTFLPLFPLVMLTVVGWYSHLLACSRLGPTSRATLITAIAILLVCFNLANFENTRRYYYIGSYSDSWASLPATFQVSPRDGYQRLREISFSKTRAKIVFDELRGKVGAEARILVIGSRFFPLPGRRPLQMDYYFGDNAIDLIDHQESLDELIARYSVKYVLFTTSRAPENWLGRKTFTRYAYGGNWLVGEPLMLGASYGFEPGEYTARKEWDYVTEYLEGRGAKLLLAQDWRGRPFERPLRWKAGYLLYEL